MRTAINELGGRQSGRLLINVGHEITIIQASDRAPNRGQLLDVSSSGLGIIARRAIAPGTRVRIFTTTASFDAEVMWCRSGHNGSKQYHRVGLAVPTEIGQDLIDQLAHLMS